MKFAKYLLYFHAYNNAVYAMNELSFDEYFWYPYFTMKRTGKMDRKFRVGIESDIIEKIASAQKEFIQKPNFDDLSDSNSDDLN